MRIEGGVVTAVKVLKDGFDDAEANERAHGFRRMVEHHAQKVVTKTCFALPCWLIFLAS